MEAEIERLCKVLIKALNEWDFDYQSPEARIFRTQHVAPGFQGKLGQTLWAISFDEQTELWRQAASDTPSVRYDIRKLDIDIHKKDRTADVILHSTMRKGDIKLLAACQLKWKFSQGRWQWYQHDGMRGIICD